MQIYRLLQIPLLALLCTSCISHVRHPYTGGDHPGQLAVHAAPPGPFMHTRTAVDVQRVAEQPRRHYTIERVSFSATGTTGQADNGISGLLYSGTDSDPRPVVIVLPVWGISEYPSNKFTRDMLRSARGAVDVFVVDGQQYLIDWQALAAAQTEPEFVRLAHDSGARIQDMVIDVRRMVDWLSSEPQIDATRIGVIGFSLSAVVAALALQHEPRFAAGAVVMGGSDPAGIFAYCQGNPGMVRATAMQRFGWTQERYREVFEAALAGGDSRNYGGRIADPARLLFIESAYDDCMSQESRDGLWEALGRPERISFRFSHRKAFYAMSPLGFNVLGRYATGFFLRTFELEE
ncbi:MAG: hypothetical protein HKN06_12850 [Gammaproteobacteria bacterium]|nr:hypothetical protein [Gammaproteobacteria bacterium]